MVSVVSAAETVVGTPAAAVMGASCSSVFEYTSTSTDAVDDSRHVLPSTRAVTVNRPRTQGRSDAVATAWNVRRRRSGGVICSVSAR